MFKKLNTFLSIAFYFLSSLFIFLINICYADDNYNSDDYEPVYMHPSIEELNEMEAQNSYVIGTKSIIEPQPKGEKSLLNLMPYIGIERNQRKCGNCWVWACTGSLEILHNASLNISDRLSIQYFNSNFFKDQYDPCEGGTPTNFVRYYNTKRKLIPWSNENADYKDSNGPKTCTNDDGTIYKCPNIEPELICEEPHYDFLSLSVENIKLSNDTNEDIINKIKYYINNDKPLVLIYCLPNTDNFSDFWSQEDENAICDFETFDEYGADGKFGCHATIITGYNDLSDNEDEHYLEILNSWGTPTNRPNGTFRLKMHMNYHKVFPKAYSLINGIDLLNANFKLEENAGNVIINVVDTEGNPIKDYNVSFNDNSSFVTGNDGKVIISNLQDGSDYKIRLSATSNFNNKEYNNGDILRCCQNDELEASGTFDFSENNIATFTFTIQCEDFDINTKNNKIMLFFYRGNDVISFRDELTINYNDQIYQK